MKCLDADKILTVQFLRAGKVRLTFDDPEVCSAVLRNGLEHEGLSVQLMPADDFVLFMFEISLLKSITMSSLPSSQLIWGGPVR